MEFKNFIVKVSLNSYLRKWELERTAEMVEYFGVFFNYFSKNMYKYLNHSYFKFF